MKILILTQKVDSSDPILGFFLGWIRGLARHCDNVVVVCLYKGTYDLPDNVKVYSLGKEKIQNYEKMSVRAVSRIFFTLRFFKYIIAERKNYDAVFVHMNIVYVLVGGWLWKLLGKKISLWHAHGYTSRRLKIAEKITDIIFTSTASGCRLESKKIKIIGQGTDVQKFKCETDRKDGVMNLITIGRISPAKDYETILEAAKILKEQAFEFILHIIGGAGLTEHETYFDKIKNYVKINNLTANVKFHGPVRNDEITKHLCEADLFINTSYTGSLDKGILEAMSCGLPVLTCNEAFFECGFSNAKEFTFKKGDFKELAEKILSFSKKERLEKDELGKELRDVIIKGHSLETLTNRIISNLELKK